RLTHLDNIDPVFMDPPDDPGRQYSVPYLWGTTGIGYRRSAVDGTPDSWAALYTDPANAGRIALLNSEDTLYSALKYLGFSLNTTSQAEIDAAVELVVAAKPRIRTFAPDTGQDLLLSQEVDLALEYSGDLQQVMAEDDDLGYIVPNEGALIWEDSMCLVKDAPNPEEAHAFVDFVLDAENAARIAEWVLYATPNKAAKALLPKEILDDPAIYPSDETLAKCEFAKYKGEDVQRMYDDALTRILAA
ncbi:MAG: polyamine ABC transporter substrate-binding protein, partial [Pseudomonadota bacterium]